MHVTVVSFNLLRAKKFLSKTFDFIFIRYSAKSQISVKLLIQPVVLFNLKTLSPVLNTHFNLK